MRKLLALITLSCAMAIGAGVSVTSANAATLTSAVHSFKAEQTSFVDKAYYRRYYDDSRISLGGRKNGADCFLNKGDICFYGVSSMMARLCPYRASVPQMWCVSTRR